MSDTTLDRSTDTRRRRPTPEASRRRTGRGVDATEAARPRRGTAESTPRTSSRRRPRPKVGVAVRPARPLVRRAHAVGLREEGQAEPRGPHLVHEHGGAHPRGRHPDGGRRRVQGRQEGRRPEEDVPGLPARALRARRRQLVRDPQHARASPASSARAPSPRRCPARTSRASCRSPPRRPKRSPSAPSPGSSTRWARPCGSRKARSPTSPARSSRSTRTSSRSRCSSTSSAGRRPVELEFSQVAKL